MLREGIEDSELQLIVSKFKQYKESGDHQNYFGRDVSFNRPPSARIANLMHVHLADSRRWGVRLLQFDRTSNTHLVYCPGYFQTNCYLLIALMKGAHERYSDTMLMISLAEIAEEFRSKF